MTFLQLCQRLRQEVGAAGNGPANVSGQTGEAARLVAWIATSWEELQKERHWFFDWAQGAIELTTLDTQYSLPGDFDEWLPDTLRYTGDKIRVAPWSDLPDASSDLFSYAAIAPDLTLHLNATPKASDNLTFEYWRTPQTLTGNSDTPRMPERFHMAIVYRAMMHYALYENAQEVGQRAGMMTKKLDHQLLESQVPSFEIGPPLA